MHEIFSIESIHIKDRGIVNVVKKIKVTRFRLSLVKYSLLSTELYNEICMKILEYRTANATVYVIFMINKITLYKMYDVV